MPVSSEVVVSSWKHVEPSREQARIKEAALTREILGGTRAEHNRGGSDAEPELGPRLDRAAIFESPVVLKVILPNTQSIIGL